MSNPKTTCAAFGCHRWTRRIELREGDVALFLCRDHWATVSRRRRRIMNKAFRRMDRFPSEKHNRAVWRLWQRCLDDVNRNVGL